MRFDLLIKNGLHFDGTGAPGVVRSIGIKDGRVAALIEQGEHVDDSDAARVIDAAGMWVTPGFLDMHTHYDAELIAAPALTESLRHGVTTVTVGSCSIGTVLSPPEDCADLFTRVEAVPREHVLPLLHESKTWSTPRGYVDFLKKHPTGPNITTFLGHSDVRAHVLGLGRSVDSTVRPSEQELTQMERLLEDALDCGFLGLSTMTNPWDKVDGDRHRSAPLPSTFASWSEYRRLHRVLRRRGAILQSAPNLVTKLNVLLFLAESAGLFMRKRLRTTLLTLADAKSSRGLHRVIAPLATFVNRFLGGDFRWQTLPVPFEVYADGIDLVVFEELGVGQEALHLREQLERDALMKDEAYRRRFRTEYETKYSPRVWQRDFYDAFIVACPDESVVGKSIGQVADERAVHVVDTFLDLLVEHGKKLRWRTVLANDRPDEVARMLNEPSAIVGFADSGAHLRNMAFYSVPLRTLRFVKERHEAGKPVMPIEKAVYRLTHEVGSWLGVDAGRLQRGDRADLVVIDPNALDERLDAYHEASIAEFGGMQRMVNRSDGAVKYVLVNGNIALDDGSFAPDLGTASTYGTFLPGSFGARA